VAIFRVQGPDGAIYRIEGPDNATDDEVAAFAAQQFGAQKPAAPAKEPDSGFLRQVADVPLGIAKGVASGVRMIADAFGAGSAASENIKGVEDYLTGLMSAQSRNDAREISRIMKEAEDKGVLDQVKAGLQAFFVAPVDLLSQALGTAAPNIVGGLGARVLGAGVAGARAVAGGVGAGMGAGVTKGAIYESVKEELAKTGMSPDQIEARAQLAQSYGGENLDQILLGTALGGLAATTGIDPRLAGIASRNVLTKAAEKSTAGRIAMGAAAEAIPEVAQGSQEQLARNLALQREGFDVPLTRGIYGAGTLEGLAGAGLGAGVSALTGRPEDAKVEPPKEGEPPKLIGYDPSSREPMYVFPDGSVAIGEDALFARRYQEQPVEPEKAEPKLLGYSPTAGQEPMYVFSDGSVAIGEDAAFARRYEPQKLSPEELSQIAPDLEGVDFQPVKQPSLPLTPEEEAELAAKPQREKELDLRIGELESRYKTLTAKAGKGESLRQVVENKLTPSEVVDIGTEPYFKRNFGVKKGQQGITISDMVADHTLDPWLPEDLRILDDIDSPEVISDKEQRATEIIKDKIRNRDFRTYEAEIESQRIDEELRQIREEIEREAGFENLRDILAEIYEDEIGRGFEEGEPKYAPAVAPIPARTVTIDSREETLKRAPPPAAPVAPPPAVTPQAPVVTPQAPAAPAVTPAAQVTAPPTPSLKGKPPELPVPAGFKPKKGRKPQLVMAARALAEGKITKDEYDQYVMYYAPINPIPEGVLEAPIDDNLMRDILVNKIRDKKDPAKVNAPIADGTRVGLRMDIPALEWGQDNGVNGSVVSIHEGKPPKNVKAGNNLSYKSAGVLKNVKFAIRKEERAFSVAKQSEEKKGESDKTPQQTMEGEWVNMDPAEIFALVKQKLNDPAWVQVSLDPLRHSYFYDRDSKRPVVEASEVLQVGRFVLAKDVKYEDRYKFLYRNAATGAKGSTTGFVQNLVNQVKQKWANVPDITVVQSISQLPANLRENIERNGFNPQGAFDPQSQTVFLIADNIGDNKDFYRTIAHESIGHFGLRSILGSNYDKVMNNLYETNSEIRSRADAKKGLSRTDAVEEVLAEAIERRVEPSSALGRAIQTIKNLIRRAFQAVGIKTLTDPEIEALLDRATDYVIEGRGIERIEAAAQKEQTAEDKAREVLLRAAEEGSAKAKPVKRKLKNGEEITIETIYSPKAFSNLVRQEFGSPISLIAKDKSGKQIGRLTYMPKGGPIDVFVSEQNRRKGLATALYDELESRGIKIPEEGKGYAVSEEAKELRKSLKQREEKEIADRERGLFALQPQTQERVGAPTGDLFGAEGLQQIQRQPTRTVTGSDEQLSLFDSDKDRIESAASTSKASPAKLEEARKVQAAIEGKTPLAAAIWISKNAPDSDQRLIAQRVADRMRKLMDAGVDFSLKIAHVGDRVPRRLNRALGLSISTIDQGGKDVSGRLVRRVLSNQIWLNGVDTGRIGTDFETVLHELVHSVTQGANFIGRMKSMKGTYAAELSKRLNDVHREVVRRFNLRVEGFKDGKVELTDFEKQIYRGANALDTTDEILAWALSSREMQEYLESIPYKGKTAWNAFVDTIRQFLGLPKSKETALSEVLTIADKIFESPLVEVGRTEFEAAAPPVTPTAPIPSKDQIELFSARIAGMKPSEALKALTPKKKAPPEKLTPEGENAKRLMESLGGISNPKPKAADETLLKRLKGIFSPTDNVSFEARFRRAVVDKDAPVIEQLQTKFNNAIKDELGVVRPDLLLMQGQDVSNFADLMTQKGGIEIGEDGLVNVFENKDANGNPINMDRVLELVAVDLGKKLGSADLAMQLAHNALIAQRADEIIKNNKRIEVRVDNALQSAKSLRKSGNNEAARELESRAREMQKGIIEVLATKEEIAAGLEAIRTYPEIKEAYDTFTTYKNNLVDFMKDSGRISALTAENWKANIGYVPWTRVEEETNRFELDPRTFKNGVVNLSALPKLDREGSTKEINNIFDNMVGLTYWAVRSGINNYAAQRTLNTLPDVEVIPEEQVTDMRKKHPDRVVFSYKNGEREAYLLANPFQLSTFSTIAPIKGGMFSAAFSPAARFLRATITHMPAFAISQLIQDGTYRAALLSGVKQPWKLPPKVFKNFYKALRKQRTGGLGELDRIGVSGIYDGMPESTAQRLRQRMKLEHRNAFKKAWDALEDFSLSADLAVRAAIYEQTMAETGDRALAYYRAKEYINFKRQGTDPIIYELRQSIPFFNAYLQGMDVLYRTMVGKGVKTGERKAAMKLFYMTGIQIAILNTLYAMMVGGDDEYEGLDDYVRNRNYIIPGTGIKIPVAPEVGFLFKVLPEQLYRTVFSEGVTSPQDATAVAKRLTGAFADAFGGVEYLPQLIKPVVELSTNYSFFMESPIVGAGLKNVDPKLQFTESTSELAKIIGGMTNMSPIKWDYFLRAYTGMAGALGLELTDSLMNPDRMGKPLYKTPQVSTFMYDPTGRGYKADFYKFREEIDRVADSVNMMKREGKAEELAEYLTEEKATRYAMRGMVNKIESQLSNLRNYRKIIAADTTLTPEERRNITREVLDQERELIKAYDVKELRKIAGF